MRLTMLLLSALVASCVVPVDAKNPHITPSPSPTAVPTPTPTPTPTPSHTPSTAQTTLVMLVNFADDVRQPWTPDFFRDVYTGPPPSVDDWWTEASGGQMSMATTVVGWWVIPGTTVTSCLLDPIANGADAMAISQGIDIASFDHRVYLWPAQPNCHFAGTANWPGQRSWQNLEVPGCTIATRCAQDFHSLVHETGHNLGLDHAGAYICIDGTGHVVLSDTCIQQNLADQFDIMGCCSKSLLSNVHRLQLGWIPAGQIVTVTTSQTITVTPTRDSSSLVYRIPDGTGQYLYLENRAAGSLYDPGAGSSWANGNLLIRRFGEISGSTPFVGVTRLLDGSPGDNDTIPNAKGMPVGSSFTYGALTVTNLSYANGIDTIQVAQ